MSSLNVTQTSQLLGKTILLTEVLGGVCIERRGIVTAYTAVLPGSKCDPEFLLEQDDGDLVFYSLREVELHSIE
jgi:hypothetical protein|tara:strand:+ start:1441 stop:1662 length:222 start_codon:yes stop_codon:yes gene_type:complete